MPELLSEPAFWSALLTLTVLEIVLGIDNIVFISILSDRLPVDLRARAMHQHQADAQGSEQVAILRQRLCQGALGHLAVEADDEGAAAKGMDIGRRLAKPGNVVPCRFRSSHVSIPRIFVKQPTQLDVLLGF